MAGAFLDDNDSYDSIKTELNSHGEGEGEIQEFVDANDNTYNKQNTANKGCVTIDSNEYSEFLRFKKMKNNINTSKNAQNRCSFIMTKEERIKYKQFIKTKQKCLQIINNHKNNNKNANTSNVTFLSKLNDINNVLSGINNELNNKFVKILSKFEETEIKCNKIWTINGLNDINDEKQNKNDNIDIDCEYLMNNNINEFNNNNNLLNIFNNSLDQYFDNILNKLTIILNNISNKKEFTKLLTSLQDDQVCICLHAELLLFVG